MSRLYSRFPARAPGAGLLLLRMAIGATLVAQALCLSLAREIANSVVSLSACSRSSSGASLIVGFLTRIVAAIAATLVTSATLLSLTSSSVGPLRSYPSDLNMIVVAVAIALLGPGAISLDAALFGRRKVIIPRSSASSRP